MFTSLGNVILEKIDTLVSKNGKEFQIVRLIDTDNYERIDLFASDDIEVSCGLSNKCQVTIQAKKNGYRTNFYVKEIISV